MTTHHSSSFHLQHQALKQHICHAIAEAGGSISFAAFMELALYTPRLGYYSTSAVKLGKHGDFMTAPELSPLFAACMARQFQPILAELGSADMLEIGAGSGVFARDVLTALADLGSLPQHYFIYEKSEGLRHAQQQLLQAMNPAWLSRVCWLDALPATKIRGIIFANEVMDALPVQLFCVGEDHAILERCVTWQEDDFAWCARPASVLLAQWVQLLQEACPLPVGYVSEVNANIAPWIDSLASLLEQGVILLADYGYGRREYYHPDRKEGTLTCFHQHQRSDNSLAQVGLQDITAHVDFTTVVESAVDAGLTLAGYTTQAAYLLSSGLMDIAAKTGLTGSALYQQNEAIKRLIMPSEMGEAVKVMGLSKGIDLAWQGFALFDRRHDL